MSRFIFDFQDGITPSFPGGYAPEADDRAKGLWICVSQKHPWQYLVVVMEHSPFFDPATRDDVVLWQACEDLVGGGPPALLQEYNKEEEEEDEKVDPELTQ